jgi:hypothetical protein
MKSKEHPLIPLYTDGWCAALIHRDALLTTWNCRERWAHPSRPDKVYLRATEPGSKVAFRIATGNAGQIRITFLRSKTFGLGSIYCWVTDQNNGTILHGYWDREKLYVRTQPSCVMLTFDAPLPPGTLASKFTVCIFSLLDLMYAQDCCD